ncbi:MAG: hypothetical protein OXF93_10350 [Acidobacteria bacterium]|nr:hypothetical protein [Acidobacteriota bacterium]
MLSSGAAAEDVYLRAGVGLDRSTEARFTDADCATHGLYGCGAGTDGAPLSTFGDFDAVTGIEVGIGYRLAPALRIEGIVQSRPRAAFAGRANFLASDRRQSVAADVSVLSGLATAYIDLAELGVPGLGFLRPFVGGGAGVSRIALDETTMTFPRTMTVVPAGRHTSLAWLVAAGLAMPLGGAATLDLAWRYLASGRAATGAGTGRVLYHDGSIHYRNGQPNEFRLGETHARLASHGLQLSLRYAF